MRDNTRLLVAAAFACAACRGGAPDTIDSGPRMAAPTELTATLTGPTTVELTWKDNATDEGGYIVEYTTDPEDEFIILDALPPDTTTFRHADLVPETRFLYRVRPFFGMVSNAAQITTRKGSGSPAEVPADPARPDPSGTVSLRDPATASEAGPRQLTAHLAAPTSVVLRWKDRSRDEQGYLVEGATRPSEPFKAFAFLEADTVSFAVLDLPPETQHLFRVRAYFHGPASNLAQTTTHAAP
jgi:hypothetical protein